jgi:hypothetical protein
MLPRRCGSRESFYSRATILAMTDRLGQLNWSNRPWKPRSNRAREVLERKEGEGNCEAHQLDECNDHDPLGRTRHVG